MERKSPSLIENIKMEVFSRMTDSGKTAFFSPASGLWILSVFYGIAVGLRIFYNRIRGNKKPKLSCMVISIGNLTMGGSGKTPMAAYLAEAVNKMGFRVVVLSRGYGGSAEKGGGVVSDGKRIRMVPSEAGDEPYMLAEQLVGIPVLVGKNRYRIGLVAQKEFKAQVLILDDGFQHVSLARDLDLVLLDSRMPIGNGYLFPRGVLREPVSALKRADALIITRFDEDLHDDKTFHKLSRKGYINQKPVFRSIHLPCYFELDNGKKISLDPCRLIGKRLTAFSGIAQNEDFRTTLMKSGLEIASFHPFPDHHSYTQEELEWIRYQAGKSSSAYIATTEKDYSRIRSFKFKESELIVIGIQAMVKEEDAFLGFVKNQINSKLS
jgi:tetraacyldisaccharide 4'-kinase